ncbi:MAG: hypothetical protein CMH49_07655 [Myxococcales bacterium]|nr:hypothetical protein [Myxococcales bacterium]
MKHKTISHETQPMSSVESWTRSLLDFIYRRPYLVFAVCFFLTIAAIQAGRGLKLRTKIQDLLPDHAPSVIASRSLSERLGSVDLLVLTLMTDEFEQTKAILPILQTELNTLEEVRAVRWQQDVSLIQKNAMITFPSLEDLKQAYQDLREEIRQRVSKKMTLFSDDTRENQPSIKAEQILSPEEKFKQKLRVAIQTQDALSLSWGELESDSQLSEMGQMFRRLDSDYPAVFHNAAYTTIGLKIFPSQASNDIQFCERLVQRVQQKASEVIEKHLGQISPQGIVRRLDLGGTYVNVLGQSKKIKGDMLSSTLSSFLLLSLVLLFAFRSVRGLIAVLVPLAMGTLWTVGLMSLTVGYLNLITAFIFAVLLGLGIDFGIHFYGRFREERALGSNDFEAMVATHLSCGHASILAASTTSAAFLALTLADFRGLSQFGGVAAIGVMFCFLAVLIVLPSILFIWERWVPLNLLGFQVNDLSETQSKSSFIDHFGGKLALTGVCLGLIGIALSPLIQLELNFNRLGPHPKVAAQLSEQERSAKSIQYGTTKATSPTVAFAQSPEEARSIDEQLQSLSEQKESRIKSSQSLYSLIPTEQTERIKWVKKLCRKLKRKYKLFKGDQRSGAEALLAHCAPSPFSEAELPQWVVEKFTDRQGVVGGFVFISPRGSTSDGENALAFHKEMQKIKTLDNQTPLVAGKTMVWAEVLMAMKYDGALTFTAALILVLGLLALFERSWMGLLFVSAPLILGLGFTMGMMALFEIKLNFFNLLALPTLIGMGVDDGVHMHHRYRELGRHSAAYIVKTTGRAASLTTLTTSIGFASLMLADHRGLNSLGLLSVLGMCAALFATLVILPALFNWWDHRNDRNSKELDAKKLTQITLVLLFLLPMALFTACESPTVRSAEQLAGQLRDSQVNTEMIDISNEDDAMIGDRDQQLTLDMQMTNDMQSPTVPCNNPCDCEDGQVCANGHCQMAQPAPNLLYCCAHENCPTQSSCISPTGAQQQCSDCVDSCDCEYGESCQQGRCQIAEIPVFCCQRSPCPQGEACEGIGGPTCSASCQNACDCWGGEACVDGQCLRTDEAAYCCERRLCPAGSICENNDSSMGMCPSMMCSTACDCPTGQACIDGDCQLSSDQGLTYCCEDAACPTGRACELPNGGSSECIGEPECLSACDCPTAQFCEAGRCVFPREDQDLLLCCESECTPLTNGVNCERLNGTRALCP